MDDELTRPVPENAAIDALRADLVQDGGTRWRRILERFVMAAIGSIPWVGGFLAAAATIPSDEAEVRKDDFAHSGSPNTRGNSTSFAARWMTFRSALRNSVRRLRNGCRARSI